MSVLDEENPPLPVIYSLSGTTLTKDEKALFADAQPLGFILFARNCEDPEQVKALVQSLHDCMGREVCILIDQEGGRVQRLKPPHWGEYPPAQKFGDMFQRNFAKGREELMNTADSIAGELSDLGIQVNCAPVMDVQSAETHQSLGDRAFDNDPEIVAALGAVVCQGFLDRGVIPVIKHLPGLGRASIDSHDELPVVEAKKQELAVSDFRPFNEIMTRIFSEAIWGMVAHVIYRDIDERTAASCSRRVIWDVIRQEIGFTGFLLSDDIGMGALKPYGDAHLRAEKVVRAGCDAALHCSGDLQEMIAIAKRIPKMTDKAVMRYNRSIEWVERYKKAA